MQLYLVYIMEKASLCQSLIQMGDYNNILPFQAASLKKQAL